MSTPLGSKYLLKSVHEDISLLDRKLAHLLKYETFPTEKARDAQAARLNTKRNQLIRTATQLAGSGVEFNPADLPASLRPVAEPEAIPVS